MLVRGEEREDESGVEAAGWARWGRKRVMRARRDALLRSDEWGVDGVVDVTSVVDEVEPCSSVGGG